eukprot:CAMPEP_0178801352 /NCGR_PEP_ID=MMETSP0745-20121128/13304_1 /TAXON_ID=913974 /ORGANISM="Nitzschia punctata, Strain CCMP561" /LENGTH=267 /DNA_ID=CAMNT_0020460187 /DNA_START=594 /DNA_END=1393 /DNA_ORIENTATION=+
MALNVNSRRRLLAVPGFFKSILQDFMHLREASYSIAVFLLVLAQDLDSRLKIIDTPEFFHVLSVLLRDDSVATRKIAITQLNLIAVEKTGRTKLITYGGSALFDSIIDCVQTCGNDETFSVFIRRFIRIDTAKILYNEESIMNKVLGHSSSTQSNVIAAKVIHRLSSFLFVNGKGMERLLNAILSASASNCSRVRYWGVKALANQAKTEALQLFSEVCELALGVVVDLASNPLNHRALTKNAIILASLTTAASNGSKTAILAMIRLT